jgi:hypothetical protein
MDTLEEITKIAKVGTITVGTVRKEDNANQPEGTARITKVTGNPTIQQWHHKATMTAQSPWT